MFKKSKIPFKSMCISYPSQPLEWELQRQGACVDPTTFVLPITFPGTMKEMKD